MKFICLGYIEDKKWETMSESDRNAMMDECFTYDDLLRKNGHFVGGEALQGPAEAVTLRWRDGKAAVTDGPYAETKEQVGGFWIIEAADLDAALAWAAKATRACRAPIEVRPFQEEPEG